MAAQWFIPGIDALFQGGMIDEDGEDEWFVPGVGMINEDQAAAAPADTFDVAQMLSPTPRWDDRLRFY